LQGVLKGANYFDCHELLSIIVVTLLCCNYLPLLQLSFSDHLLKRKKIDNYNMIQLKCENKIPKHNNHVLLQVPLQQTLTKMGPTPRD
jgi:hypothetical protein